LVGGRGGAIALGTIRQILSDLVRNELAATLDKKSAEVIPREFVGKAGSLPSFDLYSDALKSSGTVWVVLR
jgi:hypothetical protein